MTAVTDDPAQVSAKRALRSTVRLRRATRTAAERAADDVARDRLLIGLIDAATPDCVAAYLSSGTEPGTLELLDRLTKLRIEVLLPASSHGTWSEPAWAIFRGRTSLRVGPRDIQEPIGESLAADAVTQAQIVICPGLAGTPAGDRLGRGGGWYDRVLPLARGTTMLLLNDDEVLASLPAGPLDRRVDAIVTQTGIVRAT